MLFLFALKHFEAFHSKIMDRNHKIDTPRSQICCGCGCLSLSKPVAAVSVDARKSFKAPESVAFQASLPKHPRDFLQLKSGAVTSSGEPNTLKLRFPLL